MLSTIGDAAKKLGVQPTALRYYDKEGLLPHMERSESGIRMFTEDDFEWVRFIERLKLSGMPIKEIKSYIRGEYGKAPGEVNPELAKQVLGDEQPMTGRFADTLEPEFPAAREHLGTHARSEEDVLSYIAFPQQAEQFFERREQTFTASYSFKEVK